jgi:hypothetical protein
MALWKAKTKAFSIHLILSVFAISGFMLVVTQVWYPESLFELENVWQGMKILIPVDAVLGPLLTLIIFVPRKKGLKLDLSIIAILQFSALIYGGFLIHQQRPIALAFVIDRFETVLASEDYASNISMGRFANEKNHNPLLTYVLPAQSEQERSQLLMSGISIKKQPERHYPLSKYIDKLREASLSPESLTHLSSEETEILKEFMQNNHSKQGLLLLPLQGSTYKSIILVFDVKTLSVKQYLNVSPWKT